MGGVTPVFVTPKDSGPQWTKMNVSGVPHGYAQHTPLLALENAFAHRVPRSDPVIGLECPIPSPHAPLYLEKDNLRARTACTTCAAFSCPRLPCQILAVSDIALSVGPASSGLQAMDGLWEGIPFEMSRMGMRCHGLSSCPATCMQDALVLVMCNLKPAKLRGILSSGMVMCASETKGVCRRVGSSHGRGRRKGVRRAAGGVQFAEPSVIVPT